MTGRDVQNESIPGALRDRYNERIIPLIRESPWVLRVVVLEGGPTPALVIRERLYDEESIRPRLHDQGRIYGDPLKCCLPVIRSILGAVRDNRDIPLELQRFVPARHITFRGDLPLSIEAGVKLALVFRLQEHLGSVEQVELMARRIYRFSREEAGYWHALLTKHGEMEGRWAAVGMGVILAGPPDDPQVYEMLGRLRKQHVG